MIRNTEKKKNCLIVHFAWLEIRIVMVKLFPLYLCFCGEQKQITCHYQIQTNESVHLEKRRKEGNEIPKNNNNNIRAAERKWCGVTAM